MEGEVKELMVVEMIEKKIYVIRGQKVMLDSDLAALYEVETRTLIQAVKRNMSRFPSDFMFQLNFQDVAALRSQIVTLKKGRGEQRPVSLVRLLRAPTLVDKKGKGEAADDGESGDDRKQDHYEDYDYDGEDYLAYEVLVHGV